MFWIVGRERPGSSGAAGTAAPASAPGVDSPEAGLAPTGDAAAATTVYAHNLELRKGPQFRIYVRWLRGQMVRTSARKNPSFDDPDSFVLEIDRGVIRANIGDVGNFLNSSLPKGSPLTGISIQPEGEQLKLGGILHKVVPMPVELVGLLSPLPDGRVQFHVNKINVLKIPMKKLLGGLHVAMSDMVSASGVPGVQVSGNDIFFDTQKLMPPPHIRGKITMVRVAVPDIEVIYGAAPDDEGQLAAWHNFLRLNGGTLDFGKLTMHPVDLTMIDASQGAWFDLDLVNYQAQLVNGYTRMTEQSGLEIYMPEAGETRPKKLSPAVTLDWLKNRKSSVPADVPVK